MGIQPCLLTMLAANRAKDGAARAAAITTMAGIASPRTFSISDCVMGAASTPRKKDGAVSAWLIEAREDKAIAAISSAGIVFFVIGIGPLFKSVCRSAGR